MDDQIAFSSETKFPLWLHQARFRLGFTLLFLGCIWTALDIFGVTNEILQSWHVYIQASVLVVIGFGLVALVTTMPAFFRRFVGEATPGSLGAIRVLTCAFPLLDTLLIRDLASSAMLPSEMRLPMGLLQLFYSLPIGFDQFVSSEASLWAFKWVTVLILFLGMIGWRTRLMIPLGAFLYFLEGGIIRQYTSFYHTGLVPLYLMVILSLLPCGDGWSVDRLWKVYKGRPVPDSERASPVYGWSRYACWVVVALPYTAAGLSKIFNGGLYWWNATNMRAILYRATLDRSWFDWGLSLQLAQAPDILFAFLGLTTIITELLFVTVLFSRIARLTLPVLIMMVQIGIFFLMNILFLDLFILLFIFFDWTRIRKAVGRWLAARRSPIEVLYDGLCPFCQRSVRLLARLDLFNRLEYVDFRRLDLRAYNRRHELGLTLDDLEEEMYVISRGRAYRGFYGYRVIALKLPALWPLAPWLFLPGAASLGDPAYRSVARNRFKLHQCDAQCPTEPSSASGLTIVRRGKKFLGGLRYPIVVSALAVVLLSCWFYRMEYYPFTAWQMFSRSNNTSGVIDYTKVLAYYESGETSPAPIFRHAIGSLYQRFRANCSPIYQGVDRNSPFKSLNCRKFMIALGSAYNSNARPGEKIEQIEIQEWRSDFRSNPLDPKYDNLVGRVTVDVALANHPLSPIPDEMRVEAPMPSREELPVLQPNQLKELRKIGIMIGREKPHKEIESRWHTFIVGLHQVSASFDVDPLIAWVLNQGYLEAGKDSAFYENRAKDYNSLKETIRNELTLAHGMLSNENRKETSKVIHRKDFSLMSKTNGQVVVEQGSVISSQPEVERYIKDLERQLASVEDDSRLANRDLQKVRQIQQQVLNQMMSTLPERLYETAMDAIRKAGG
jgi:predicted DCC family thiol-disulfide oxidoreductase YuxK